MRSCALTVVCLVMLLSNYDAHAIADQEGTPQRRDGRDHDVMELLVRDLLDPNNPEYELDPAHRAGWPKQIVINVRTYNKNDYFIGDDTLDIVAKDRGLSKELTRNWRRRNSQASLPVSSFKIQNKNVKFEDIDQLAREQPNPAEFGRLFDDRFPDALCFICPYLPAYSDDGLHAVAVLYTGPSIHGTVWVYHLESRDHRWKILWRQRKIWE